MDINRLQPRKDLASTFGDVAGLDQAIGKLLAGLRFEQTDLSYEAGEVLRDRLGGTEVILLKASRGVAMESLLPGLEARFGPSIPASGGIRREGAGNAPLSGTPLGKGA